MKNSWPVPLYTIHSSYGAGDNRLFVYKVLLYTIIVLVEHNYYSTHIAECISARLCFSRNVHTYTCE